MDIFFVGLVTGYNAPEGGGTRDERTPHHSDVAEGGRESNNVISPLVLYVIFGQQYHNPFGI